MGLLTDTKLNANLTTVPEPVRNYLALESGDRIEWFVENAEVVVRKKEPTIDEPATAVDEEGA